MEPEEQRAWIEDVKHRFGLVTAGSDEEEQPVMPEWPVLEPGTTWKVVSEQAMASFDGVHFYVKPDGMTMADFISSLR